MNIFFPKIEALNVGNVEHLSVFFLNKNKKKITYKHGILHTWTKNYKNGNIRIMWIKNRQTTRNDRHRMNLNV